MVTKASKNSMEKWQEFEREVAHLLFMQGYQVKLNRTVGARQTDMLAIISAGNCAMTVLVECKYHDQNATVGVIEVTDFCARVNNARMEGRIDKGFLVTNTGFTRQAFDCVESCRSYVALLTRSDLERSLIDFSSYTNRLIQDFEKMPLSQYMVDLTCRTAGGRRHASVSGFVLEWLRNGNGNQMCILGDYGTGKTSFCLYLSYLLAKEYSNSQGTTRIPILILLREYVKAGNVKTMVTDWLVNECGLPNGRYVVFRRMLENGRFVLILDGFDEMTMRTNLQVIHDNFRNLSELYCPKGKLIIAGRPEYFPDLEEMNRIILTGSSRMRGDANIESLDSVERRYWHVEPYCLLQLGSLTPSQVKRIILGRAELLEKPGLSANELVSIIRGKYDLSDLSKRPVLLDMIVRTYCEFGKEFSVVNTARLYELYTSLWIERDRAKGEFRRLVTPEDKKYFMEQMAWWMYTAQVTKLHYTEIPYAMQSERETTNDIDERDSGDQEQSEAGYKKWLHDMFKQDSGDQEPDEGFFGDYGDKGKPDLESESLNSEEAEYLTRDIMTCSFLTRDQSGYYRFAHTSFMEFFVAMKVFHELADGVSRSIMKLPFRDEISQFLAELVASGKQDLKAALFEIMHHARIGTTLSKRERGKAGAWLVTGAANVVGVLSRIRNALKGINLQGINLEGARLASGAVMTGACLNESFISNTHFGGCILTDSQVEGAEWENVDCSLISGENATFSNATITNSRFRGGCLRGAIFTKVAFIRCDFGGADLEGSAFEECDGRGLIFSGCRLGGAKLVGCVFRNANFDGADLAQTEWVNVDLRGASFTKVDTRTCRFTKCLLPKTLKVSKERPEY